MVPVDLDGYVKKKKIILQHKRKFFCANGHECKYIVPLF